jgi:hypothetical protein
MSSLPNESAVNKAVHNRLERARHDLGLALQMTQGELTRDAAELILVAGAVEWAESAVGALKAAVKFLNE